MASASRDGTTSTAIMVVAPATRAAITALKSRVATDIDAIEWAKRGVELGAGEILLTSMGADGTKDGFELGLTRDISTVVRVPVIASGGAGNMDDFADVFAIGLADAALAASVFHYAEIPIPALKAFLEMRGIEVRI